MANELDKVMSDIHSIPGRAQLKSLRKRYAEWKEVLQSLYPHVGVWGKSVVDAFQSLCADGANVQADLDAFEERWMTLKRKEECVRDLDRQIKLWS